MRKRRLAGDWQLYDGVMPPVRLGAPARACDALAEAGVLLSEYKGLQALEREWVMRRSWRYSLDIDALFERRNAEERAFIRLTGLCGAWRAYLDGAEALNGDCAHAMIEIIGAPERLEIAFSPEPCDALTPSAGLMGDAYAVYSGAVALMDLKAEPDAAGKLLARVTLNASRACVCQLIYRLRAEDGDERKFIARAEFDSASEQTLTHMPYDKLIPGVSYELSLEARVLDALSDEISAGVIYHARAPRGLEIGERRDLTLIADAGGDAAIMPDTLENRRRVHECGLILRERGNARALNAPVPESIMRDMAADLPYWPPTSPVWALNGARADAFDDIDIMGDDISEYIALSRYRQAELLRAQAEDARAHNEPLLIEGAFDPCFKYASCALFDGADSPRPAYAAIKDAWRPAHAYARAPEQAPNDGIVSLPIYCVADAGARAYAVRAHAYSLSGDERAQGSFPVISLDAAPLGRLSVELPEDGFILMRLTVVGEDGGALTRSDALLNLGARPLASISKTQLLLTSEYAENAGETVAVGVSIPGAAAGCFSGYGALLPGEKLVFERAGDYKAEALNIFF